MVVLLQRRQAGSRLAVPHLVGILLAALLCGDSHHLARAVLICRVVEQSADVVDKKRVE